MHAPCTTRSWGRCKKFKKGPSTTDRPGIIVLFREVVLTSKILSKVEGRDDQGMQTGEKRVYEG